MDKPVDGAEALAPAMDDALVEKVARAIQPVLEQDSEIYWASEYGRPTPDASLTALARAAIAAADDLRLAGVKEGLKMAADECMKVSGLIGAATGSSIDSALCQAAASIRSLGPRP